MTSIDVNAFNGCSGLTDVYCFAENIPSTSSNAFSNANTSDITLHVPAVSLEAYQTTEPWSGFGTIVALTDEELTGVLLIDNGQSTTGNEAGAVYDLNGRHITKPTRGIYVRNGKKVAIK